jgi:hypothetical protein
MLEGRNEAGLAEELHLFNQASYFASPSGRPEWAALRTIVFWRRSFYALSGFSASIKSRGPQTNAAPLYNMAKKCEITSPKLASLASKVLSNPKSPAAAKQLAGSVLTQAPNKRR